MNAAAGTPLAVAPVLCLGEVSIEQASQVLARWKLHLVLVADDQPIPGSYWGEREAGLARDAIYARRDTPLQSLLHEACHFVCMDGTRRSQLMRDAGGDYDEENAVCYLQILLADYISGFNRERMLADMDAWGYTFRLGSAQAWFESEAQDARRWLLNAGVIDMNQQPTWRLRS